MKFENTRVFNFEGALRGMRNPKNSWEKSDSVYELRPILNDDRRHPNTAEHYIIGENDLRLAQTLIRAGSEHRKFMRQIFVSVDITAPIFWWKEFDTYKVGTVANSTSTMHKIHSEPINLESFETDDMVRDLVVYAKEPWGLDDTVYDIWIEVLDFCETLRKRYVETKDKRYWKELIRLVPCGWLQKRTVTMSYENLLAMCGKGQRRFHKLNEWSGVDDASQVNFIDWARTLPYARQLIFLDEIDDAKKAADKAKDDRWAHARDAIAAKLGDDFDISELMALIEKGLAS